MFAGALDRCQLWKGHKRQTTMRRTLSATRSTIVPAAPPSRSSCIVRPPSSAPRDGVQSPLEDFAPQSGGAVIVWADVYPVASRTLSPSSRAVHRSGATSCYTSHKGQGSESERQIKRPRGEADLGGHRVRNVINPGVPPGATPPSSLFVSNVIS